MPRKSEETKDTKKKNSSAKSRVTEKKATTKSKVKKTTKKSASKVNKTSTTKKKATVSKSVTSKSKSVKATKKTIARKTSNTTRKKKETTVITEYYDLPQKYNQTIVKVLAQTPKTLFIYWEISDEDIQKYKDTYGENFFETTKPILKIYNKTLNYSFETEINDFANSWYLHVNDSKSDYSIELGRRPINSNNNYSNYIYIASSNEIESPNDHILFNNSQKMVYFKNVKTNQISEKNISTLSFMRNMGKIYDIYDLYLELYKNEENLESLSNPSSQTSSQFK